MMKKFITVMTVLIVALGSSACNTMRGFGRDVERGGEKVQGAAEESQNQPSK